MFETRHKMREGRGTHFVVVSADSKNRATRQGFLLSYSDVGSTSPLRPTPAKKFEWATSHRNIFPLLCVCPRFLYLSRAHSFLGTVGVQKNCLQHVRT